MCYSGLPIHNKNSAINGLLPFSFDLPFFFHFKSYIRDNFLGKGWNDGQTLIEKFIWRGYIIANTSLRFQLTSSLRSDLSTADRPNIGYCKTILPHEVYVLFEVIIYALFCSSIFVSFVSKHCVAFLGP